VLRCAASLAPVGRTQETLLTDLRSIAIAVLVAVGLASSIAHLTDLPSLATLARASVASPLPRAFSQTQSLAGFAKEFTVELTLADGTVERRRGTASLYVGLPGPYERQVLYGAALTFGPNHPRTVFGAMLRYGFCRSGPLAARMGVHQSVKSVGLIGGAPSVTSAGIPVNPRRIELDCPSDARTP